jgi:hypothetical protein
MIKTNVFICIILMFSLYSCREKSLSYDIPFVENKLVVNGFLNPNEGIEIIVSKLMPVKGWLDSSDFVRNATISVYENDKFVEQLKHKDNGIYVSNTDFKIKKGKLYHVEVQAPNYHKAISKKDSLPIKTVQFTSGIFTDSIDSPYGGVVTGAVDMKFNDLETTKNFYAIKFKIFDNNKAWPLSPDINNSLFGFGGLSCEYYEFFHNQIGPTFSNKCFKGKNQNLNLKFWSKGNFPNSYNKTDSVRVLFHTLNKNTFNYIKSLSDHYASRELFAAPSEVLSNIQNGYGFIGFYDTDSLTLKPK